MEKEIYVKSYVKKDGTQVREHYRTIDTEYKTPPMFPENKNYPILDKYTQNNAGIINLDPWALLQGGISVDVGYPTDGTLGVDMGTIEGVSGGMSGVGEVIGSVLNVGLQLAPLALQMYQAMNSGNRQALQYLKPQFDTKIKLLETRVVQMKQNIDNSVIKLVNVKNKQDYTRIYEGLAKDWQVYQHAKNIVNRIKIQANNNDYQSVANDLGYFVNNSQKPIISELLHPDVKMQNNINNAKFLINKYNLDDKFEYALNNNVSGVNHSADFSVLAENNYLMSKNIKHNSDRPNTREMANIFLAKPSNIPLSKEYSYIPKGNANIINFKYNLTGNKVIPQDWEGIIYNQYSSLSKNISNSTEMQNEIKNQFNIMKTDTFNDKLEVNFSKDSNLHLSLGHATILEPYIDSQGYFHGILFDKYDFDIIYSKYLSDFKKTTANNLFYFIQLLNGHNYYIFAPIIFKW